MNRKVKAVFFIGAVTLALLTTISLAGSAPWAHSDTDAPPAPRVRPVLAYTKLIGLLTPRNAEPTTVSEESAQVETQTNSAVAIDFVALKHSDVTVILAPTESPRDKPTPASTTSQTPRHPAPYEPKMGDSRIVDGQKQVYFLGFGWIDDNDEPNVCTYAPDMYENGNKIGEMGGGTVVDGEGDINKMVGTM